MNKKLKIVVNYLKGGGIGVLPTDTIYGLVTSALDKKAVERVYKIRKRNSKKPLIILISSLKDLSLFGVKLTDKEKEILENIWPGKVSVILHCNKNKFSYLHRGTRSLAFRLPKKKLLIDLIKKGYLNHHHYDWLVMSRQTQEIYLATDQHLST